MSGQGGWETTSVLSVFPNTAKQYFLIPPNVSHSLRHTLYSIMSPPPHVCSIIWGICLISIYYYMVYKFPQIHFNVNISDTQIKMR